MATLISAATGNLTTAATWKKVAAAGLLDSNATPSSTALTTGTLDSATFVLAAVQVDAFALKLAARAAGSPSNTVTAKLRNSTTATDVFTVTLNVSDLAACTTTDLAGGWYVFAPGATHTPNGTDSYLIRLTVSATTTAVSFYTNGTANNWARMVRETTTQAPAAGDNLIVAGEHTGAGTGNTFVVTMDSTAATDYGTASTTEANPAVCVNPRSTLAYGTTAATNYILRISGHLSVYAGGIFTIGTVATPIPRGGTAVLEFDLAVNGDFGLVASDGSTVTMQGLSRTSGKTAVWALLTANLAAAGTSATIDTDTGWLSGDVLALASTSRSIPAESETITLNANAGASSLAWTGGVTYAHLGSTTEPEQAEVVLLTRSVMVRSTLSTAYSFFKIKGTAVVDLDWVDFRYWGYGSKFGLWITSATGGSVGVSYCVIRDSSIRAICSNATGSPAIVIEHTVGYRVGITATLEGAFLHSLATGSNCTLNDLVGLWGVGGINPMFYFAALDALTYTNFRAIGASRYGLHFSLTTAGTSDGTGKTFGPWTIHGCGDHSLYLLYLNNVVISSILAWRGTTNGLEMIGCNNVTVTLFRAWAHSQYNLVFDSPNTKIVFTEAQLASETGNTTTTGIGFNNNPGTTEFRIDKGDFGTVSGTKIAHTTQEFACSFSHRVQAVINNCLLTAGTLFSGTPVSYGAWGSSWSFGRYNRVSGSHKTYHHEGILQSETTTVDVSPGLKITPNNAGLKLDSSANQRGKGFLVGVASGATVTVTVKVQKDGTYNGAAPRLLLKTNSGLGFDADVVAATLSVAANTWETLSYTTAAAADTGVLEFVVDVDGTAGNVFVDTWTAS